MKKSVLGALAIIGAALTAGSVQAKPLVIYFSQPEAVSIAGVDYVSGASVLNINGVATGSLEYLSGLIADKLGADVYRIETVKPYPLDHEPLINYAKEEQAQKILPPLKGQPLDLSAYDEIFLGYPIWWYDLPQAVYTFLNDYDLSGKTIYPFTSHGGSRFSGTLERIAALEPGAKVEKDGLCLRRNDVFHDGVEEIEDWLEDLGFR